MRPNRTVLTKKRTRRSCLVFVSLRFIFRFFVSSVADACVPPSGRFPRSLRSLGMTNYTGGSGVLYGLTILKQTYTRTALSLRGAQSATRQSPGREDGRGVHERNTRQPTCPRWLTAEKSYAVETARRVPAPAHLPAVAHRRAKRTEWRMRGIEPNKNVTSFSHHPSCLRDASAIRLLPRGKA